MVGHPRRQRPRRVADTARKPTIQDRAEELTGPDIAEIARDIAGDRIDALVNPDNQSDREQRSDNNTLIRLSVEAEISSEGQSIDAVSPALEEEVQTLLDDVDRIRKDVTWLRSQEQDEVAISDLAQDVFDELETLPEPASPVNIPDDVEDTESYRQQQAAAQVIKPDDAEEAESEGTSSYTAKALAEQFDTTEDRIHDAISHLQDQFLPVVELEVSGDTQYFKEA